MRGRIWYHASLKTNIFSNSVVSLEIVAFKNKESITVARSLDQVWLCHYPRPVDCLDHNGTEFVSTKFQELLQSYGIPSNLTTVKNPQANGILDHTHQVFGNLLHSSCCALLLKTSTPYLPTRTSHASYVGHQRNITYNLKGKPSSTCIQLLHDSSNFLCHQLVCHQQLQTNSITICH
jgi:hypothetical protein